MTIDEVITTIKPIKPTPPLDGIELQKANLDRQAQDVKVQKANLNLKKKRQGLAQAQEKLAKANAAKMP